MIELIKLQDKFILVSDEEIKEGDRFYSSFKGEHRMLLFNKQVIPFPKDMKIISENPDFSLLKEEDCLKIGYVDVERISKNFAIIQTNLGCTNFHDLEFAYKEGFQDAQSLNDKMFSLEDMVNFSKWIADSKKHGFAKQLYEAMIVNKVNTVEELVSVWRSLQQVVWEVEVEMGYVKLNDDGQEYGFPDMLIPKITNGSIKITKIL